eukprot:TRINITY_DN57645_c0_g1_i1.p1 TRINITY_DN57645_c0_g1~~TRINITY_DN57645_c0_g1_i1.p1  ORF type:complete len:278 (+),score=41.88 TRINITY_DN57645_c0_g1_i1:80-913(+)
MAQESSAEGVKSCGPGSEFCFDIPECEPNTIMKVTAPDGILLNITRPPHVLAGDKMHVIKGENGQWGVKVVVRAEAVASVLGTTGEVLPRGQDVIQRDLNDTNVVNVQLQTTKGPIVITICPSWAPLGAQRFLQLVTDGFYTDMAIYRAVPKFLIQFGVTNDTEKTSKYAEINDDPLCGVPISEGSVCFAASGPNTRKYTICIFLDSFPQLGKNPWETPFGMVQGDSLATLRSIHTGYGDMPHCGGNGPDPIELEDNGNDYIRSNFPKCDFVESASW